MPSATNIVCACGLPADTVARSERDVQPDRTIIRRWRQCVAGHMTLTRAVELEEVIDDYATNLAQSLVPVVEERNEAVAF